MTDAYQSRIENLSELLKARAATYPVRDKVVYPKLVRAIDEFSDYLVAELDLEGSIRDKEILDSIETFKGNPVFLCGSMKSGTTLLLQLLDDHPGLVVMPGDSHYANRLDKWERDDFAGISRYCLQRLINPTGKEPFWFFGQERASFEKFLRYLHYFLSHTRMDPFLCIVFSVYAVTADRHPPHSVKYWVEKTPHNELHVPVLINKFSRAKFIHIVRDPLNNIASLVRLTKIRGWETYAADHARQIEQLFEAARSNQQKLGPDNYLIVKYENLISNTRTTMRRICDFLDLSFSETLLVPTEGGRPAMSNSMFEDARVRGEVLDQSTVERYKQELTEQDLREVVTILYEDALEFGYDWSAGAISRYRQAEREEDAGAGKRDFLRNIARKMRSFIKSRNP